MTKFQTAPNQKVVRVEKYPVEVMRGEYRIRST